MTMTILPAAAMISSTSPSQRIPISRNTKERQELADEARMARMAILQDQMFYDRLVTGMKERQILNSSNHSHYSSHSKNNSVTGSGDDDDDDDEGYDDEYDHDSHHDVPNDSKDDLDDVFHHYEPTNEQQGHHHHHHQQQQQMDAQSLKNFLHQRTEQQALIDSITLTKNALLSPTARSLRTHTSFKSPATTIMDAKERENVTSLLAQSLQFLESDQEEEAGEDDGDFMFEMDI